MQVVEIGFQGSTETLFNVMHGDFSSGTGAHPLRLNPWAHCTPAYASLCVGHVARPIPPSCISPTRTVLTSVVARPELADMDERVLTRALRILEEQGKAVVIDDDEEPGVKFF